MNLRYRIIFLFILISHLLNAQNKLAGKAVYQWESFRKSDSSYQPYKSFTVYFSGDIFYSITTEDKSWPDFLNLQTNDGSKTAPPSPDLLIAYENIMQKTFKAPKVFDIKGKKKLYKLQLAPNEFPLVEEKYEPDQTVIYSADTATKSGLLSYRNLLFDNKNFTLEAWFAPSIPSKAGPEGVSIGGFLTFIKYRDKSQIRLISLEYPTKEKFKLPYQKEKTISKELFDKLSEENRKKAVNNVSH
jgi:hypothetical protein